MAGELKSLKRKVLRSLPAVQQTESSRSQISRQSQTLTDHCWKWRGPRSDKRTRRSQARVTEPAKPCSFPLTIPDVGNRHVCCSAALEFLGMPAMLDEESHEAAKADNGVRSSRNRAYVQTLEVISRGCRNDVAGQLSGGIASLLYSGQHHLR